MAVKDQAGRAVLTHPRVRELLRQGLITREEVKRLRFEQYGMQAVERIASQAKELQMAPLRAIADAQERMGLKKSVAAIGTILAGSQMLPPSRANAAEPSKPAGPAGQIGAIGNSPGGQVPGQEKPGHGLDFGTITSSLLLGLGAADLRHSKLRGSAMIATGALMLANKARAANAAEPVKPVSQPSGPSGPIGATGNSPGGQVPGQPEGPGLLTKAAVHVASSIPGVAPVVQAAKDPETALRLGIGALGTAGTVQAARMLNPAARAGAKFLTKAMLPLTVALAAMDTVKGYEKDGVKGAALGLADSLTGGLLSLGLEKAGVMQPGQPGQPAQPSAPATPQAVVSDRLDVARAAASRVTGEMSQTTVMNQGSTRPANAEIPSDGMTDDYFRQQNGRQVRVSGYQTPSR